MNSHLSTPVPQCFGFPDPRAIAVQIKKILADLLRTFVPFFKFMQENS